VARLKLENDLRVSTTDGRINMLYQPIVRLDTTQVVAVEALLRCIRPGGPDMLPIDFMELAEERGLIVPLGEMALNQACRQLAAWRGSIPEAAGISVSVNLSRRQLADPGMVDQVDRALRESGLPSNLLNLEITEGGILHKGAEAPELLARLKRLGVNLFMDNFGTGYSSLSCVHACPLDALKIDGSFLNAITANRDYAAVISAVMVLARRLGIRVIAECVESAEQVALLRSLACECAQGYYFAPPMDVPALERFLRESGRRRAKSA
jgi:EAL domain-containing protein (putative c-di-GMP-specific phosphodiesterase class I)